MNPPTQSFTCPRATDRDPTLSPLRASPGASGRLTIFTNASPGATPEVCARGAARFPRLVLHRNPRNVGWSAHHLRAVEAREKESPSILCDDDELDFARVAEVADAVGASQQDLIPPGVSHHAELPRGLAAPALDLVGNHRGDVPGHS